MSESHATEISDAAPPRAHPYRAFVLRAGLGIVVVGFLLWHYDARPVFRILARERGGFFVAAVALYVASQVMSAWRWQLLAAVVGVRARFSEFLAFYFVGMFTNLFVPGLVGGDAARAVYLGRKQHRLGEAIASVIADRGLGLIALFWFAAAMAFAMPSALASTVIRPTIVAGVLALAGFLSAPIIGRLLPYLPRPLHRAAGIVAPYLHHPVAMIPAIVLSIILQVSLAVGQWLLGKGLGLSTPLALFLLCVPIANVFASLPLTLNGLGVRETAYLVLFGMVGMGRDDAIALGLLWFAATMLGGLTGVVAFIRTPLAAQPTT
ncbi:MAG TPA: lysylphosphatidylglycerol synthase transmembrane domain-containing protein [Candidatus Binataceae bacterium]|nr:lysylphosphatidylglycerol synthase transmembrane domain-containing protein [Candidatus Binataceae bacterium]